MGEPAPPLELPARRSFGRSAAATWGTGLAVGVLSLVNVLIIARELGPVGRGTVAFLFVIAYITSQFSMLSAEEANANFARADAALRPALATNSLTLALLLGGGATAAVLGTSELVPALTPDTWLQWTLFGAVPMLGLGEMWSTLVQADYRFAIRNVYELIPPVTQVVVNGVFWPLGLLSVGSVVFTWIAGQALAAGLLGFYLAFRLGGFGRPSTALARRTLGFGLRAYLGRLMTVGNYRLDQWFVGAFSGSHQLGLYNIAVAWAEALNYLPSALAIVQRPDLVNVEPGEAAHRAAVVLRRTQVITLLAVVGMVAAAPILCVAVFGAKFRGSTDDLQVLAIGAFGVVTLKLLWNALIAQGRPLLATAGVGVAFVSTVVLDVLLIPRFGGLGAAFASTISYSVGAVAVGVIFVRALGGRVTDLVPRPSDARALTPPGGLRALLGRRG
jgi:O-antigen/teichoic acid export membrane protein